MSQCKYNSYIYNGILYVMFRQVTSRIIVRIAHHVVPHRLTEHQIVPPKTEKLPLDISKFLYYT